MAGTAHPGMVAAQRRRAYAGRSARPSGGGHGASERLRGTAAGEASSSTGRAWRARARAEGRGAREGGKVTAGATQWERVVEARRLWKTL